MNNREGKMVRSVWRSNVDEEMAIMESCLDRYPLIAFDTEYPGTIYRTSIDSSDDECYRIMKSNVESTKLIQFGFTLFNMDGDIGGVWEFNFCNFGDPTDKRNESSIAFLKSHGLDFQKIREEGIDMFRYDFFLKAMSVFVSRKQAEFITFQGAYDFAYILCILNHGKLPETHDEFASDVLQHFGTAYDTKFMAAYCGLSDNLGLSKLAHLLQITDIDRAHNAGSDSLRTALVFIKLLQNYEESIYAPSMIYGVGNGTFLSELEPESKHVSEPLCLENNGYVPNDEETYYIDASGALWRSDNGIRIQVLPPNIIHDYRNQTPPSAI